MNRAFVGTSHKRKKPREPKFPGSTAFLGDNHYCAVAPLGLRFPGRKDLVIRSRSLFSVPYNTPNPINTVSTIVEYASTFVHSATPASSTAISVFSLAAGTAAAVFVASIVYVLFALAIAGCANVVTYGPSANGVGSMSCCA